MRSAFTPRLRAVAPLALGLAVACAQHPTAPPAPTEETIREHTEAARAQPAPPPESRPIRRVAARPKVLPQDASEPFDLSFEIDVPGRVVVSIEDEAGQRIVRRDLGAQPRGRVRTRWDGRTRDGDAVAPGVYRFRIDLEAADGVRAFHPTGPGDGGKEVLAQRLAFDPEKGVLSYVLPQPARVRVRAQLRSLPLLETLLDWAPQAAGRHEIAWDGRDASGLLDVSRNPDLQARIDAYALPPNALIVEPDEPPFPPRPPGAQRATARYRHARHDPERCHEPAFSLEFPGASHDRGAPPRLAGDQSVRVTIDPADADPLLHGGYELMFFVDLVFLFEEEEGTNPFNFTLDTARLTPGLHFLTVNLLSYDDHAGVVTVPFYVE